MVYPKVLVELAGETCHSGIYHVVYVLPAGNQGVERNTHCHLA
ncbi:hypothetical protein SDC9_191568 [bioreactor metagenome]|uniref:Uncharacterized protein n=1 Tax=bioreactor metagenome TaxID=1076179 RepID=A0A645HYB3_9ZZZZ